MSSLRVYHLARELVRAVQALLPHIAPRSRNLADQLERSSLSCPSNIAEAEHRFDGNGRLRLETAFGSAKETRCHLELAVDLGCVPEALAAPAIDLADHLAASASSHAAEPDLRHGLALARQPVIPHDQQSPTSRVDHGRHAVARGMCGIL